MDELRKLASKWRSQARHPQYVGSPELAERLNRCADQLSEVLNQEGRNQVDLTAVPDAEFKEEMYRRERAAHEAWAQEQRRQSRERLAREEAKDREFAESIGITYEQLQSAEDYVRDKVEAER